ncbi:hypothetical protein PIB30_034405 [Stylosanthes scabra]|uniref:Uncharacterized protein n=1 Tax=Stylosanthes scabra TaxID=79078 RepID=A0ABU6Z9L4_9FABA|nr:hypothetical protein [Stylosanthes scabra]
MCKAKNSGGIEIARIRGDDGGGRSGKSGDSVVLEAMKCENDGGYDDENDSGDGDEYEHWLKIRREKRDIVGYCCSEIYPRIRGDDGGGRSGESGDTVVLVVMKCENEDENDSSDGDKEEHW